MRVHVPSGPSRVTLILANVDGVFTCTTCLCAAAYRDTPHRMTIEP
jgi:hypothetical protein